MRWLVCVVFVFAIVSRGMCQETKIAVVDMEKVMKVYPEFEKGKDALKKQLREVEDERDKMVGELEKKRDSFETLAKAAGNKALSDEERKKKEEQALAIQKEMRDLDLKIRKTLETRQKELSEEELKIQKKIVSELREIISEYAKKKGYGIVYNSAMLMYSDEKLDVTKDILDIIEKNTKKSE